MGQGLEMSLHEAAQHLHARWRQALCGTLALLLATSACAAPAPWQVWRSKLDGGEFCAQASPGPSWEHVRGPFRDSQCSKPASRPDNPKDMNSPPTVDPDQAWSRSSSKSPSTR
jgi:hypothetical protein